jgi:hypothetical protein
VEPRAILRLEELGKLKKNLPYPELEPVTYQLVA